MARTESQTLEAIAVESEAVDAADMIEAIMGWREPAYLRHNVVDGPNEES